MRDIDQYTIVEGRNLEEIVFQVNSNIHGNWQPFGNLVVTRMPFDDGSGFYEIYRQAMVAYVGDEVL